MDLAEHLPDGDARRLLFDRLQERIAHELGPSEVVALPCCVHLFGTYDFLAVLPKKGRLELRFSLDRGLDDPRITRSHQTSRSARTHCIDITSAADIDDDVFGWIREAYHRYDG